MEYLHCSPTPAVFEMVMVVLALATVEWVEWWGAFQAFDLRAESHEPGQNKCERCPVIACP